MGQFEYQPHLVAFIDILGFKELVKCRKHKIKN